MREVVRAIGERPFPAIAEDGPFRILVTGGSQGATILSTVVPEGLGLLPDAIRQRLQVTQQCRPEDIEQVRAAYRRLGIPADLATYLTDMPAILDRAHLVIARAGASTIAELTVAGRPAILVPLPSAMDDHQTVNAREMSAEGGARMIAQAAFTPAELARQMLALLDDPEALIAAASRARACGLPHAAHALADLVESFGRPPVMDAIGDDARGAKALKPKLAMGKVLPSMGRGTARSVVEGALSERFAQPHSPTTIAARWSPSPQAGRI